ncbi:MOT12 protein, partial [Xiphorhynchus elegans]|nr:MOT12 protein [Xiphorhynchus elegans]
GPLGAALSARFGARAVSMAGGALAGTGLLLGAFATRLEHLYLSLGGLAGLGWALVFTPSLGAVSRWFPSHRSLATGVAVSGATVSGLALGPLVPLALDAYGWRGALLLLAGVSFNLVAAAALLRPPRGAPTGSAVALALSPSPSLSPSPPSPPLSPSSLTPLLPSSSPLSPSPSPPSLSLSPSSPSSPLSPSPLSPSLSLPPSSLPSSPSPLSPLLPSPSSPLSPSPSSPLSPSPLSPLSPSPSPPSPSPSSPPLSPPPPPPLSPSPPSPSPTALLRHGPFLRYAASFALLDAGYYVPFVHGAGRAHELGLGARGAAAVLAAMAALDGAGRVASACLAARPGAALLRHLGAWAALAGVAALLVPLGGGLGGLVALAAAYGACAGAVVPLQFAGVAEVVGTSRAVHGIGLMQMVESVGSLLGAPLAG